GQFSQLIRRHDSPRVSLPTWALSKRIGDDKDGCGDTPFLQFGHRVLNQTFKGIIKRHRPIALASGQWLCFSRRDRLRPARESFHLPCELRSLPRRDGMIIKNDTSALPSPPEYAQYHGEARRHRVEGKTNNEL